MSAGGAIGRNSQGQVLISLGCKLNQCASAEEAEALALLHGLREFAEVFTGPVQVEVDCQAVAKALAPGYMNKTNLFPITADITSILLGFESFEIRWTSRDRNKVAQYLASRVRNHGNFSHLGFAPREMKKTLLNDYNMEV